MPQHIREAQSEFMKGLWEKTHRRAIMSDAMHEIWRDFRAQDDYGYFLQRLRDAYARR